MSAEREPFAWRPVLGIASTPGDDVAAWRAVLERDGYDLAPAEPSRAFTRAVHNATISWQRERGLESDGLVGPKTRAAIGMAKLPRPLPVFDPGAVPYLEAAHWRRDIGPQTKTLIVIHSMETLETATTAEACAAYFAGLRGDAPRASAHYCVDSDSVVCAVPPDRIAWHAPGANHNGIGVELAGFARQTAAEWRDDFSFRMLTLAAQLCAYLCREHGIAAARLDARALRRPGARGITTHADVSRAFGKSSHWDPGPHFPMREFVEWVRDAL